MQKNDLLTAYFGSNEVIVSGGFSHPDKGYMVEIVGIEANIPGRSVSVWELHHLNTETAKNVFAICFNRTPEQAVEIDLRKGVLKTSPELLKNNKQEKTLA